MIELEKFEARIIAELSDDKGHCNWELAKLMGGLKGSSNKKLAAMKNRGLIYEGFSRRTTNPKQIGKNYREIPYYINYENFLNHAGENGIQISKDLDLFRSVVDSLSNEYKSLRLNWGDLLFESMKAKENRLVKVDQPDSTQMPSETSEDSREDRQTDLLEYLQNEQRNILHLQEKFLSSPFVDKIITLHGFKVIYKIIMDQLSNEYFRKIASKVLLSKTLVIREYAAIHNEIREYFDMSYHQTVMPYLGAENLISILADFDPLMAVSLCREVLIKEIMAVLKEEGLGPVMADFIELDMHISPLTSYPLNNPIKLLLQRPFERLFSDIYLFNQDDLEKLVKRAYILYSNFSDLLPWAIRWMISEETDLISYQDSLYYSTHEYSNNKRESKEESDRSPSRLDILLDFRRKHVESIARQAIFYWNISSHILDQVYHHFENSWEFEPEGYYYIRNSNEGLYIKNFKDYYGSGTYPIESMLFADYFLCESGELFGELRPCISFTKMGLSGEPVPSEEIISKFKEFFESY